MVDLKKIEKDIENILKRYDGFFIAITMSEDIDWRDSCKYEIVNYIKNICRKK